MCDPTTLYIIIAKEPMGITQQTHSDVRLTKFPMLDGMAPLNELKEKSLHIIKRQ